jgi:protocatechuate 3,4-dioxygenase beta subunit
VYIGGTTALAAYGLLPTLSVVTGNNQTAMDKTVLPVALSVVARDSYVFAPISGVVVTCNDGGVGGAFEVGGVFYTSPIKLTTDAKGTITFSYKLPAPRAITITCLSLGYTSAVFSETSVAGPPAKMTVVSGNNQSAGPNTALAPVVVKVVDANGFGVPGVTVNFTDNGAGGTFVAKSLITNSTGNVSAQYTTGTKAMKVTITASTGGLHANAVEYCVAGPAANIAITSGNNQSGTAGTQLPAALTVLVTDQYGNPVSGNNVTFDDGGAGGSFAYGNPVVTGTKGTASQLYTLPSSPGTITIKATATGITNPAVFTETAK